MLSTSDNVFRWGFVFFFVLGALFNISEGHYVVGGMCLLASAFLEME